MAFRQKTAKTDCTTAMLPHTRKEVFFDVLKLHWKIFLVYGLLVMLFSLPLFFLDITEDILTIELMENFNSATKEEQQNVLKQLYSLEFTRALLDIAAYLILSVCIAGLIRVIRQYAWEEAIYFSADFPIGIKQNAGQMIMLGLVIGIVNFFTTYAYSVSSINIDSNIIVSMTAMLPVAISVFVGIPVAAYTVVSISLYKNKFHLHLLNGLSIYIKTPFKTLFALLCCATPFVLQIIPNFYCHIFGRLLGCIFTPFVLLGWFLFASDQFDNCINQEHFPELVGKGTFSEDNNSNTKMQ